MACQLRDMGCYEVSLGDTIGIGTPSDLYKLLQASLQLPTQLLLQYQDIKPLEDYAPF